MKKYFLLILFCAFFSFCISQIPNISNEFAKDCSAVSVVNSNAYERVFCKGIIEENYGNFIVRVQISEEDVYKVKEGQLVEIFCKALGKKALPGKVKELYDFAYKTTYGGISVTVVDAIIEFDEAYKDLKSGYSVTAEIIYTELKNAVILPFECVAQEKNGKYYVYRIDKNWAIKEYVEIAFEEEKGVVVSGKCEFKTICEDPESFSGDFVRIKNVGHN